MNSTFSNLSQIPWAGRGKNLTVPTLNFSPPQDMKRDYWVYAGIIETNTVSYPAAVHFGPTPTFADTTPRLEVNLIDVAHISFAHGTVFQLTLIEKIRDIQLFESPEWLKQQILIDIGRIREILRKK
jgi:FAD synthase